MERLPSICQRCLRPVARSARKCPHCGVPLERWNPLRSVYITGIALAMLGALAGMMWLAWWVIELTGD